jgi:hypothetical protein
MIRTIAALLLAGVPAAAALTGCAAPDPAPVGSSVPVNSSAPVAGSAPVNSATVAPVEVTARLVDGRVDPAPRRVDVARGTPVVLLVEVDAPTEVHVHGYDREAGAAPGAPARIAFTADVPGVFEVEAHPETLLLQLAVR